MGEAASLSKSSLMLAFRLALQTFDAIGVRYLDSQLVKKRIKTFKNDSQQHHPKPRATSPLPSAVRDHFRTGGDNTKLGGDFAEGRTQQYLGCSLPTSVDPLRRVSQTECHGPSTLRGDGGALSVLGCFLY